MRYVLERQTQEIKKLRHYCYNSLPKITEVRSCLYNKCIRNITNSDSERDAIANGNYLRFRVCKEQQWGLNGATQQK